jgi:hypothetical protein
MFVVAPYLIPARLGSHDPLLEARQDGHRVASVVDDLGKHRRPRGHEVVQIDWAVALGRLEQKRLARLVQLADYPAAASAIETVEIGGEARQVDPVRCREEAVDRVVGDRDARYSTVTVFARLRGWSTFRPRARAMR